MSRRQGIFWILTIPYSGSENEKWSRELLPELNWIVGQLEVGEGTGFKHWQIFVAFKTKQSCTGVMRLFPTAHAELSRSEAAVEYCRKQRTAVPGTAFEYGAKPIRRNSATDWEDVWTAAKSGDLERIPAHCRVVCFSSIVRIGTFFNRPDPMVRTCNVYWGATGTGKSRRAWTEAGLGSFPKDPRTKFWDGYQGKRHSNVGESHVVLDEFRGGIDIAHLLRWTDRYPLRLEVKGATVSAAYTTIWITSNLDPRSWYPDCDSETVDALMRRLEITFFPKLN